MATSLTVDRCRLSIGSSFSNVDANGYGSPARTFAPSSSGFAIFDITFANGTASEQANQEYIARYTITATTMQSIDLAGSLTNIFGTTITFATLKIIHVKLRSPDGTKAFRIGPQNVANAFIGPWGGSSAIAYELCQTMYFAVAPYTGWTVTAGTVDLLNIYNPGATSIDVDVWLVGTQ